ncbi:DUF4142 domain-containing protein [Algoriphagus halophytocola]|uniref:DUF4142 domain-containing protein n=1 Tax=Algoriphagus halophytocola TaxID=2991499 RepID=A0ABY6MFV3_9BACT|nr:DUF4142 domain-containing protein [Algoriphagus sp. TR-M5]UZD22688.1 DUF4142 domain-containing protein [Algoriphagus sp. TR-M5]
MNNQPQNAKASTFRKLRTSAAVMLSAICLVGMTSCEDEDDDPIVDTYNQQDRNFAMASSENLNAQISFGQLALDNGEDDSVLEYATMLVSENTDSQTELEGIVDGTDVEISDGISDAMQTKYDELAMMSGEEFDKAFIDFQLELLDDSMSIYENEEDNGENFTLKGFAEKTLEKIKDHREDAVLVKAEIEIEGV